MHGEMLDGKHYAHHLFYVPSIMFTDPREMVAMTSSLDVIISPDINE